MRTTAIVMALALVMAPAGMASAASVWGTAWGNGGGSIFKTDLETGSTTVLRNDYSGWFGDIAEGYNGFLYATMYTFSPLSDQYEIFTKIDRQTGTILGQWDLGGYSDSLNALTTIDSNTLYGVQGGNVEEANLVEIKLDGHGDYESIDELGVVGAKSDGDIARGPNGTFYATFWDDPDVSPRKPILREITVVGGVASSTILTTLDVPYTAGLVNDDGTLWGGKWDSDMNLYTIDPANGQFTVQYDLSTVPGLESMSGINGLSPVVPEPMTMLAFGSAVAGIGGYIRRRRRA